MYMCVKAKLCTLGWTDLFLNQMRSWKAWEKETRTAEYQFSHGNINLFN